jgi:hypothetical protein
MKYTAIIILILAPLASRAQSNRAAKVEELLTVMNVAEQQKQMMEQMSNMAMSQIKDTLTSQGTTSQAEIAKAQDKQRRLFALIQEKTSWENMRPVFVKAYAETFTDSEIDGMLAFYKTPAGKAMITKQPAVNGKIMSNVQGLMADLVPQMEAIMKSQ